MMHAQKLPAVMSQMALVMSLLLKKGATGSLNLLVHLSGTRCGSTPSRRFFILFATKRQTCLSVAEDQVRFIHVKMSTLDGTLQFAGGASNTGSVSLFFTLSRQAF